MRLPGGGHKRFPHLLPSLKPRDSLRGGDSSFEQEMEVRSSLSISVVELTDNRNLDFVVWNNEERKQDDGEENNYEKRISFIQSDRHLGFLNDKLS